MMRKITEILLANRYQIIDKIGEGGMGIVWRVFDTVEQREVALKQIYKKNHSDEFDFQTAPERFNVSERQNSTVNPELDVLASRNRMNLFMSSAGSSEGSLRFKQEFRTMSKLRHLNTVEVFDYGVFENGNNFITMEIVPGEDLNDILKKRRLSFSEIYHILIQISQVLNFVHSRLMVHRDIKSANIRITPEGNVKLMDFGLMIPLGQPGNGEITGTAIYLPPEAAQGGIIDGRSDLYSLGILAYELVTGRPPFMSKKIPDLIKQHIKSTPQPPCQLREDTPRELERLILKLLAKNQEERYQSTGALIHDLVKFSGEKIAIEAIEQQKSYLYCSELIGRKRELQKLIDTFHLTGQRQGQSILVASPAGVGKSRLIQEFKLKVQLFEEARFVEGRCFEQGMTPYQPIAEAFRILLPLVKKEVLDRYGRVLVKVMPQLKNMGYGALPKLDDVGEKVRLFDQVTGWLKEVSKVQSVVICIEDLHWADLATCELFNACIRETKDHPIMILGTFRDDEVEDHNIIFQTTEEKMCQLMKLTPLSKEDVQSLIHGMLGRIELSEDFTEHVYKATDGNAFFVTEMIRVLIEEQTLKLAQGRWILPVDIGTCEFPDSIESTILRRLIHLKPGTREIARMAAVVGRSLDLTLLKSLSGLEDEALFGMLDELMAHQFMKREEKRYILTHDRVREILYKQIEASSRRILHEKCGYILEQRYSEQPESVINELAYHFHNSDNRSQAVNYLLMAGDQAMQINAFVVAIEMFRKAERHLEHISYPYKKWILLEVWDKLTLASLEVESKLCIECGEKFIKELSSMGNVDGTMKVMKFVFKGIALLPPSLRDNLKNKFAQNDPPPISRLRPRNRLEKVLTRILPNYSVIIPNLVLTKCYVAAAYTITGEYEKSLNIQEEIMEDLPDKNSTSYAAVLLSRAVTLEFLGHHKTICQLLRTAIDIFEDQGISSLLNRNLRWLYANCYWLHEVVVVWRGMRLTDNGKFLEKGLSMAETDNFMDITYWLYYAKNHYWTLCGNRKEIERLKETNFRILKRFGRPAIPEGALLIDLGQAALEQGELETAQEYAARGFELAQKEGHELQIEFGRTLLGLIAFERGDVDGSIKYLETAITESRNKKVERLIPALYSLGEIYLKLGELDKAAPLVQEAHTLATSEEMENPYYQIHTYRIMGQIAQRKRQYEQAEINFNKSLEMARQYDISIQKGLTLVALADIQAELTKYSVSKKTLEEAEDIFKQIDNNYLFAKVRGAKKKLPLD